MRSVNVERVVVETVFPHSPWLALGPMLPPNDNFCWAYSWIECFT